MTKTALGPCVATVTVGAEKTQVADVVAPILQAAGPSVMTILRPNFLGRVNVAMKCVQIGDCTLVHGDCLAYLPTLAPGSVDSAITDPPYEAEAHTLQRRVKRGPNRGVCGVDGRDAIETPLSFEPLSFEVRESAGKHIARLVKRWAIVFCQCEATQLWRSALEPLSYRRTSVWIKPDAMPQYSGDRPGMGYESIVCCHAEGRSRWNGGGRVGVFIHNKNSGGKHEHETQKPIPLMAELLELFTDDAETILDPFMGSGTTGVACVRLGRKFIGVEICENYFNIAVKRIQKAYEDRANPLFGDTAPKPVQLDLGRSS